MKNNSTKPASAKAKFFWQEGRSLLWLLSNRYPIVTLLSWVAVLQVIAFYYFGVYSGIDTEAYITNSNLLLEGSLPEGRDLLYFSYLLVLLPFTWPGVSENGVVIIQIISYGFSVLCLFSIGNQLFKHSTPAFIAAFLYASWYEFYQWNLILYTESLFVSFTIITFYYVLQAEKSGNWRLSIILLLFTVFLRPVGILFLVFICTYLYYPVSKKPVHSLPSVLTKLALLTTLLSLLLLFLTPFFDSMVNSYASAEVIYPNQSVGLTPPTNLNMPSEDENGIFRVLEFLTNHPLYFGRLAAYKLFFFALHIKPYYSVVHNLFVLGILIPVYIGFFVGLKQLSIPKVQWAIGIYLGLQYIMVAVTSENWDGRFFLPVLPWLLLFAAFGWYSWCIKMKKNRNTPQV